MVQIKIIVSSSLMLPILVTSAALASDQVKTIAELQGATEPTIPLSQFEIIPADDGDQPQVTSVSQLSDVQPTDWAFQALQSLVERYGCIAGYPNGTFRGSRAATRYELAAALNSCLDQISDKFASKEDLAMVKALQEEFKAELTALKGRVDGLEARTATLEAQQFSTTTKLAGEAIFQGAIGNNVTPKNGAFTATGDNATFYHRLTLNFLTSFTGKDLLITTLQEGTYPRTGGRNFDANGNFISLSSVAGSLAPGLNQVSTNNIGLYYLGYRFPILKDKGTVFITALGGELSDFTDTLNPYFDNDGQGALSGFGIRNPIYRHISSGQNGTSPFSGTGLGANFNITKQLNLAVGYLVPGFFASKSTGDADSAFQDGRFGSEGGLFGSDYTALAQITYKPSKNLGLGLTYVRSYQLSGATQLGGNSGTLRANFPFFSDVPSVSNSGGFQFSWQPSTKFALSGWFGATFAQADETNMSVRKGDTASILNGAITLAFPDLFSTGNLGGLIFGVEPTSISNISGVGKDTDINFHVEALYRIKINDNISITPGAFIVVNPEGSSSNDPIVVGTVRTTFSF
jgi:Carbohydrate-selective porin, OprB family/S-layer homology domain